MAYLGHVISEGSVAMDANKVAAVAAWPLPCSARGLRCFLGLAGYYRKFIQDFSIIAAPLTRLLRRDAFVWDDDASAAFEALKRALTTGPVLQMPDFTKPFVVDCDASGAGFGAVLHQGVGPLAYFSHPFADRHIKLAAYEWELIGLDLVRSCTTCQRNKTETVHPVGLLQPLDVPTQVWADISMDFIEGLPKVVGKSVILTVVDRFSKYAHFIALGHPYTATSVARAFFDGIVRLHGFPLSIVSDRDPVFTGHVWRDIFKMASIQLRMSIAFHPQTDGQSEVVNKVIAMYLCCVMRDRPRAWVDWLSGRSTATTPPSTRLFAPHRLRSSMVALLRRRCPICRWHGFPEEDVTWESVDEFRSFYPDFQLEDELFEKAGRDVMTGIQYSRRRPSSG
ncbi:uncharacterized protein [Miscanthus floridulus]|uniref:uncharacterized protein n=1 Tax=Miscanthus floridulus TaxID=154761 RepID=UPI003458821E